MSWRPVDRIDRQTADLWGGVTLALILLLPLWRALLPIVPACPARSLTGIPCLSCGTTRAVEALARGHLLDAMAFNPLTTLAILVLLAGGIAAPLWVRVSRRVPAWPAPLPPVVRAGALLGLAVNWAYLVVRGV